MVRKIMKNWLIGFFIMALLGLLISSCAPMMPKGANPKYKGIQAVEDSQKTTDTGTGTGTDTGTEKKTEETGKTGEQSGTQDTGGQTTEPSGSSSGGK